MRRVATPIVFLIVIAAVILIVLTKRTSALPQTFNKKDLPQHGLILVRHTEPEFQRLKSMLASGAVDETQQPYVFIKNLGPKRVVAYALKWELTKDDGRIISKTRMNCREDILLGNEAENDGVDTTLLRPQKARLFSLFGYADGFEVSLNNPSNSVADPKQGEALSTALNATGVLASKKAELAHTTAITVSMDAALFEDGTFVGPNATHYFERLQAQIGSKQDLVRELMKKYQEGTRPDDIVNYVESERAALKKSSKSQPTLEPTFEELYNSYREQYCDQILKIKEGTKDADRSLRQWIWLNVPKQGSRILKLKKSSL
jgi:hypothetical protein